MSNLHALEYGSTGPRVVLCHGLFGQGRNWNTIAKGLADRYRVTAFDLPNHGRSPWTSGVDYVEIADQIAAELPVDEPVALVGHSMGGKVAMMMALRHPALVERLCVVDVAPVDYGTGADFRRYIDAMRAMDLGAVRTREDADRALAGVAPDPEIRAFLLQNLRRDGEGWCWQANLNVLGWDLSVVSGWPADRIGSRTYEGPVLWVAGAESGYVFEEAVPVMKRLFPRTQKLTVKGAGHWVHSDQPEVFLQVLRAFLAQES